MLWETLTASAANHSKPPSCRRRQVRQARLLEVRHMRLAAPQMPPQFLGQPDEIAATTFVSGAAASKRSAAPRPDSARAAGDRRRRGGQ